MKGYDLYVHGIDTVNNFPDLDKKTKEKLKKISEISNSFSNILSGIVNPNKPK